MKDLMTVASYTIKDMVKRKSFLVSNIIILLLIVVGFNIPNIISTFTKGEEGTTNDKILVVDNTNLFEGSLETLKAMDTGYDVQIAKEETTIDGVKEKIKKEEINSAFVVTPKDGKIDIEYVIKNIGMTTHTPDEFIEVLQKLYQNVELSKLNITQAQMQSVNTEFNVAILQADENGASGNIFVVMLLSILLFYAIYFCAYQVSTSITTEKTSKIMETLVTSTTPRTIVLGKTIGIGIVGLFQIIAIIVVALLSAKFFMTGDILSGLVDVSKITPLLGVMTLVYFILGYSVYALCYALTGSTVSKPEDVQSANSPVALLAVGGFYLSYFTMMNPGSDLNAFAAIFPFSSPFCMPFRIMMGVASMQEIAISLAVLIVTSVIIARISIKIYSSAVLNYGSKLSLKDMMSMYKDKNN